MALNLEKDLCPVCLRKWVQRVIAHEFLQRGRGRIIWNFRRHCHRWGALCLITYAVSWGSRKRLVCVCFVGRVCFGPAGCSFPHCFSCRKRCRNKHKICVTLKMFPDIPVKFGAHFHVLDEHYHRTENTLYWELKMGEGSFYVQISLGNKVIKQCWIFF